MRLQPVIQYVSRFLEPTRVFIALMLAVGMWLFPFISFKEKTITPIEHGVIVSADPFTAGAIGECADVHCEPGYCCVKGYCKTGADNCADDDPPPPSPPSISANLNCSDWGDNGWCKGSLSIDLSAADPQGQAVVISGAVNGNNFACPSGATSCSIPLSGEGTGSVSYQVNSATGLSAAGSLGYQIDLTSPDLDTSVSGAAGTNGWYRSDVTLSATASDATSGIASITASINGGGATSVGGSLTFSDGEYSVLIVARDNAGHVTQDTQIIKVDTITPSLSFTTGGTNGKNGWYVSSASATATAGDSGSGLASIEASVDGGGWTVSDSISLGDGVHTYQFRATDVAGNKTETPTQTALVDTIAPSISMSQGTSLGEKVLYEIEDYGSGLSIFRAVIEDDDEAYQKVTWSGDISGSYIADDILWDGKFADGAKAGIGEYMVTLKITDAAGNKAIKTTFVTVGLLDLLDDIPAFSPPVSSTSEEEDVIPSDVVSGPISFGGIPTTTEIGEYVTTNTSVPSITIPTTNIPIDPNILWGAAATAMVGATLADWQRQREEEARRKEEERRRRAEEGGGNVTAKRLGLKAQEDAVRQRWADQKQEKARQERANNASTARWEGLAKQEEAKQQARINDANAARWAGLAAMEQKKEEAKKAQEQAALDHRMGEHTGEQDKVDAWKAQEMKEKVDLPHWNYPWLSISGSPELEKNLFSEAFVGVKNVNQGIGEIFFYEEQNLKVSSSVMVTRNPSGFIDVNITNGDITLSLGNYCLYANPLDAVLGVTIKTPNKDNPSLYSEDTYAHDYDFNWGWMTNSVITAHTEVSIDTKQSTPDLQVEQRDTVEGEIRTVKTTGVMLVASAVLAGILIAGTLLGGASVFGGLLVGA